MTARPQKRLIRFLTFLLSLTLFIPSIVIAQPSEVGERGIYYKEVPHEHPVQPPVEEVAIDPTLTNCYLYVKSVFHNLPSTEVIKANTSQALGDVAVFYYADSGLWHYAVVESVGYGTFSISETNFGVHKKTHREVSFSDPAFVGFYSL